MQIEFEGYFNSYKCDVSFGNYSYDNSVAIMLICENGEPYGAATVCLEDSNLEHDEVVIDVNNAPFMPDVLVKAGLIEIGPVRYVKSGYVSYPVHRLTDKALRLIIEGMTDVE